MRDPNFLINGGVATGTSFLSATLVQHPEIYLPRIQRPEPNFFHYTHKYRNGLDWYLSTWFSDAKNETAVGERSSLQLPSVTAPERLATAFPNIRLIFCLRNPIERAWGNYRFTVLEGLEDLSFSEALMEEPTRMRAAAGTWAEVQPHAYVWRSRYSECLRRYIALFGRENLLFIKSETLSRDPRGELKRVCDFLRVDSRFDFEFPPDYSSPAVSDRGLQSQMRSYFGDRFPSIIEAIRREEELITLSENPEELSLLQLLQRNLSRQRESMTESERDWLKTALTDEIQELSSIVDFNIDDWK